MDSRIKSILDKLLSEQSGSAISDDTISLDDVMAVDQASIPPELKDALLALSNQMEGFIQRKFSRSKKNLQTAIDTLSEEELKVMVLTYLTLSNLLIKQDSTRYEILNKLIMSHLGPEHEKVDYEARKKFLKAYRPLDEEENDNDQN